MIVSIIDFDVNQHGRLGFFVFHSVPPGPLLPMISFLPSKTKTI